MQVTEVSAEGLKRQYRITVPAAEIESRVQGKLAELGRTVRMPGFRPGKVPLTLLRRQHGQRLLGEILEQAVNDGSRRAIGENELRPALQPKVEVTSTSFGEGADLEFTMDVEVLPEVPETDLKAISLERPRVEVEEAEVEEALGRMAASRAVFADPDEPKAAEKGDRLILDFVGKIDGEAFEGGSAGDQPYVLGSGQFIPGFEEPLYGKKPGETATSEVTFPEAYPEPSVAGKPAVFAITVKAVQPPGTPAIDDELAKGFGVDTLDELRGRVREQMGKQYAQAARAKAKRRLLDRLAEIQNFAVPQGMVDMELESIWRQLTEEMERTKTSFAASDEEAADGRQTEEAARAEYRGLAERRVRLGLLLADVGTRNTIKVEPPELQAAVIEQARRYPGQERQVFEFFQKNPQAVEQLRAPIFEDKVVDFILEIADVTDKTVSKEELFAEDEDDSPEVGAGA